MRANRTLVLLLLLAAACSAPPVELEPDAGDGGALTADAGTSNFDAGKAGPDAGRLDAGPKDAGMALVDAGAADAGSVDAGASAVDAGSQDAGVDAGEDAGAATPDAGATTRDAGLVTFEDAGTPDTTVTVDTAHPGATVPDDFLGLSVEWSHVPDVLGDTMGAPRPAVQQLLAGFAADGHAPVLRIGGNSEDEAYWNPSGAALPSNATVSVGATHLQILEALGHHVILGLNLRRDDTSNAAALVTAALAQPLSVDAFEVGNEPDLYGIDGVRPLYYSPLFYQPDFESYFPALSTAASGQALFAAPAIYGTTWFSSLGSFFTAEHTKLSLVTLHHYPYNVCVLGQLGAPTIADLFSQTATTDYATTFAPVVTTAAASGLKVRIAEMNSVSCGGVPGVSDVYASGLWGADVMFELASVGVAGVNIHTPGHYPVFDFAGPSGALEVRGLYYGMLLFSKATAQQGKLLPTTTTSAHQVRAWSTVGTDGVTRVALLNEDLQSSTVAAVTVGGHAGDAEVWHLSAPAMDTVTAITFAGQTFDGSTDGKPLGTEQANTVVAVNGAYRVALAPGSAAVLAVP